jgi:uncharacterized protein (TIGR00251 family)
VADAVVVRESGEVVRLSLRVRPGARGDRLVGPFDGALKLEVRAAPERGRANRAVVDLLARCFGCARSEVEIIAGTTGRSKIAEIHGRDADGIVESLRSLGIPARPA